MASLANDLAKGLLGTTNTTDQEARSQTQQHRGEDRAEDSSLDDVEVVLGQQDDEKYNLDHGAQTADNISFTATCTLFKILDTHVISVNMPMTRGSFSASVCPAKPMRLAHGTMAIYDSVKMRMCRSSMVSVTFVVSIPGAETCLRTKQRKEEKDTHIAQPKPQARRAIGDCRAYWPDW